MTNDQKRIDDLGRRLIETLENHADGMSLAAVLTTIDGVKLAYWRASDQPDEDLIEMTSAALAHLIANNPREAVH